MKGPGLKTPACLLAAALFLACWGRAAGSAAPPAAAGKMLVGVKLYEYKGDFAPLFTAWREMGINTAFVSVDLAGTPAFMESARKQGVAVYIIMPVFYNPEALAQDPGLYAVTGYGRPAKLDWVEFVCPRRPEYRTPAPGLYPPPDPRLPPRRPQHRFHPPFRLLGNGLPRRQAGSAAEHLFLPCIAWGRFKTSAGCVSPLACRTPRAKAEWILKNHPAAWTKWKQANITSMVRDIAAAARRENPGIKLNLHLVPWRRDDFNGAMRTVVGQDIAALGRLVDYLSPMCYAHMVKRTPDWIRSVVRDVQRPGRQPYPYPASRSRRITSRSRSPPPSFPTT